MILDECIFWTGLWSGCLYSWKWILISQELLSDEVNKSSHYIWLIRQLYFNGTYNWILWIRVFYSYNIFDKQWYILAHLSLRLFSMLSRYWYFMTLPWYHSCKYCIYHWYLCLAYFLTCHQSNTPTMLWIFSTWQILFKGHNSIFYTLLCQRDKNKNCIIWNYTLYTSSATVRLLWQNLNRLSEHIPTAIKKTIYLNGFKASIYSVPSGAKSR